MVIIEAGNGAGIALTVASNATEEMRLPCKGLDVYIASLTCDRSSRLPVNCCREPILGRRRDFVHCFKISLGTDPGLWKACFVFMQQFYVGVTTQIRCVASAHLREGTSFVISTVAMRRPTTYFMQMLHGGLVPAPIAR